MTDKKCPKCGSNNFQIVDYFVTGYIYEVENGVVNGNGADDTVMLGRKLKSILKIK